jgi:cation:H+ antiporter
MMTGTLASLQPHVWFAELPIWLLILIAVIALAIVIKGADWLVEGAAGIAKKLGMPEVVVGATIVSLGTTSPEMAVSVLAAFSGNAGLALGNGSGVDHRRHGADLWAGVLVGFRRAPGGSVRVESPRPGAGRLGVAARGAGLWHLHDSRRGGALTKPMGLLLVGLLFAYLSISVRLAHQHPVGEPRIVAEPDGQVHSSAVLSTEHMVKAAGHSLLFLFGMGLIGLTLMILAGDGLVQSVTILATQVGVPQAVIATTIIALGTSLPELVTGMTAIRKGHAELLVGNVIGTDILNVLFVIGLAAVAADLPMIDTGGV